MKLREKKKTKTCDPRRTLGKLWKETGLIAFTPIETPELLFHLSFVNMFIIFSLDQRAMRQIRQCHKAFIAAELKCKQKTDIVKELVLLVDVLLFATRYSTEYLFLLVWMFKSEKGWGWNQW